MAGGRRHRYRVIGIRTGEPETVVLDEASGAKVLDVEAILRMEDEYDALRIEVIPERKADPAA
jgi:Fe-S cluster assembly ATPase SufC